MVKYPKRPTNESKGAAQRLQLYVPSHETWLSLGEKHSKQGFYGGANVSTASHIFTSASGSVAKWCSTTFESSGQAVVQSLQGSIYAAGMKSTLVGANASIFISSKNSVFVSGSKLVGVGDPTSDPQSGESPSQADAGNDTSKSVAAISRCWSGVQTLMAVHGVFVDGRKEILNSKSPKIRGRFLTQCTNIVGAFRSITSAVYSAASAATPAAVSGTIMHGDSAMVLASPTYTSVFGGASVTAQSINISWIGSGVDTSVYGVISAQLITEKDASVTSGRYVEICAPKSINITSRLGEAYIGGKSIVIGKDGGSNFVGFDALSRLGISAKNLSLISFDTGLALRGKSVSVSGKEDVSVTSTGRISLGVGSAHLQKSKTEIILSVGGTGEVPKESQMLAACGNVESAKHYFDKFYDETTEKCRKLRTKKASWKQVKMKKRGIRVLFGRRNMRVSKDGFEFDGKVLKIST